MIDRYVTNLDSNVFALRNLPEEVIAVLFAYYSRSPGTLLDNLNTLLKDKDINIGQEQYPAVSSDLVEASEKAKKFHEKWTVGYGHGSVAEHACVHLACENVSILAAKDIEDARLASFTEKSTRYVVFDENKFYITPEYSDNKIYIKTCKTLLSTYTSLMPKAIRKIKKEIPKQDGQSELAWETSCKTKACDVLRYLLPTSTLTNLGITVNAREAQRLIQKLTASPLTESRNIGVAIMQEAEKIIPTLIRHTKPNYYAIDTLDFAKYIILENELSVHSSFMDKDDKINSIRLVSVPDNETIERDLLSYILYEYSVQPLELITLRVRNMLDSEVKCILRVILANEDADGLRMKYDTALRTLEHFPYTWEIQVDYGAYRDIQRHRMSTQTRQMLSTAYGYETPQKIYEWGFEDEYEYCMRQSHHAYIDLVRDNPYLAQYVLPLAWRIRFLMTMNLREMDHFIKLRSGKRGHISYRKIAQDMWQTLHTEHPFIADMIEVDNDIC